MPKQILREILSLRFFILCGKLRHADVRRSADRCNLLDERGGELLEELSSLLFLFSFFSSAGLLFHPAAGRRLCGRCGCEREDGTVGEVCYSRAFYLFVCTSN